MFENEGFKTVRGLTDAVMQRQEILSSNLANIETKGYVRQDVDFSRVLSDLKNDSAASGEGNESILARSRYRDYSKPMTLESELSKLYDNHLRYLLLVKSINHHFDHMKKALEVRAN
ncbi:MAG: hypothetical protein HY094_04450 [Candidatus Melainabacteria bacterium]|nr:hypothetical protein [Candidatus Melainabacteria bacterium]